MRLLRVENKVLWENLNFEQYAASDKGGNTFYFSTNQKSKGF
jgi:hypothetical protein